MQTQEKIITDVYVLIRRIYTLIKETELLIKKASAPPDPIAGTAA